MPRSWSDPNLISFAKLQNDSITCNSSVGVVVCIRHGFSVDFSIRVEFWIHVWSNFVSDYPMKQVHSTRWRNENATFTAVSCTSIRGYVVELYNLVVAYFIKTTRYLGVESNIGKVLIWKEDMGSLSNKKTRGPWATIRLPA